jgi:sugar/nucleoside kinase (ribokinase family)
MRRATGRIGVLVAADGERSFVADRGAADLLTAADLREGWFTAADGVHLPAYSLLGVPLGIAGRRSVELGRVAARASRSTSPPRRTLLAGGRAAAHGL